MTEERRITMEDCRRAGHCVRGVKKWIEERGYNFMDFLQNGLAESEIKAMHDGYAQHIIDVKDEVENGHGRR